MTGKTLEQDWIQNDGRAKDLMQNGKRLGSLSPADMKLQQGGCLPEGRELHAPHKNVAMMDAAYPARTSYHV